MAVLLIGGLEGIRTLDPHNANVVRSQLRYKPINYYCIIWLRPRFVKHCPFPYATKTKVKSIAKVSAIW